jgi:hypothetical protein
MTPQLKSLQDIRRLAGAELSLKARLGYVALLLVSTGMTVVIASLWLTETFLPPRAQLAFGVMCLIGVSWATLALWALSRRRPLFARDRVIAGGLAVTFTSIFLAGALAGVVIANNPAAYGALAMGVVMLGLAMGALASARRRFAALAARRAELEGNG